MFPAATIGPWNGEDLLATTVRDRKMTVNEIQPPALVAEAGQMGNVGL
jgi:hypothetical protein